MKRPKTPGHAGPPRSDRTPAFRALADVKGKQPLRVSPLVQQQNITFGTLASPSMFYPGELVTEGDQLHYRWQERPIGSNAIRFTFTDGTTIGPTFGSFNAHDATQTVFVRLHDAPIAPQIVPGLVYAPRGERATHGAIEVAPNKTIVVPLRPPRAVQVAEPEISTPALELPNQRLVQERLGTVEKVFRVVELFAPKRVTDEELGDAREEINALVDRNARACEVWLKVASTIGWLAVNVARHLFAAVKGKRLRK